MIGRLLAAALIAWAWPAAAQVPQGSVEAGVRGGVALVEVVTRVGFETTIVLPPDWRVVERRLGDPDRWIATGGGHLTMVRPLASGVATNLSLVLSDGSVLSVGLRESELLPVYTVVHLSPLPAEDAPPGEGGSAAVAEDGAPVVGDRNAAVEDVVAGTAAEAPVFLSAADVEAIRREEERALQALRSAEAEVRDRVADAVAATGEAVAALVAEYPTRLHFAFEFDPEVDVTAAPYWIEGMWHDTQSTFLRFRRAVDDRVVVEGLLPDGTARVLAYEVIGDGLVIRIDGVVEAGTVGIGDNGDGAGWRLRREAEPWQTGN